MNFWVSVWVERLNENNDKREVERGGDEKKKQRRGNGREGDDADLEGGGATGDDTPRELHLRGSGKAANTCLPPLPLSRSLAGHVESEGQNLGRKLADLFGRISEVLWFEKKIAAR